MMKELRPSQVACVGMAILLIAVALKATALRVYTVPSESMAPALLPGDTLLVTSFESLFGWTPRRAEVVVVRSPHDGRSLVKRVIGLPGDHFEMRNGDVWINGKPIPEPYLSSNGGENIAPLILCQDCYYVLGDHRAMSVDSRLLGPVHSRDLVGPARVVFWTTRPSETAWNRAPLERMPFLVR